MAELFVPVDENLNATLSIGTYAFPFQLFHDDLDHYANRCVNWHRQRTIEISVLLNGTANVQTLNQNISVQEREGFVIFPGSLHMIRRSHPGKVKYFTLIFDPVLLYGYRGSFFYEKYYRTYVNQERSLYHLPHNQDWEQDVFQNLWWIYEHEHGDEFEISQRLRSLWHVLCRECFVSDHQKNPGKVREEERLSRMILWLHEHYQEKFSLSAFATAFHISRGECCRFFRKTIGCSPLEYLQNVRLQKAIEYLEQTGRTITEISEQTGFSTVSYFTGFFKKQMGYTPQQYRKHYISEKKS